MAHKMCENGEISYGVIKTKQISWAPIINFKSDDHQEQNFCQSIRRIPLSMAVVLLSSEENEWKSSGVLFHLLESVQFIG